MNKKKSYRFYKKKWLSVRRRRGDRAPENAPAEQGFRCQSRNALSAASRGRASPLALGPVTHPRLDVVSAFPAGPSAPPHPASYPSPVAWFGILILKLLQTPGIRHVHAAIFGLQLVKAGRADAVLAADLGHSQPVDGYADAVYFIIPMICVPGERLFRMRLLFQGWADFPSD